MTFFRALTFALAIACTVCALENRVISISGHLAQPAGNASTSNGSPDGLTVSTQQGPVIGTAPATKVREFLGIPYAVASRWEAPTSPPNRTEPFNASSFGDSCPQQFNAGFVEFLRITWGGLTDEQIFVPESEDCQNINIWAPSLDRAQKTAVLVWIYGGSFSFGTSNTPQYNGFNLVRDNDDITVVSFNYRTNVFGSPNALQLNGTGQAQNFGFLDADAAIKWVYENIESFGGDPERITLFGQSAGGELVDAYTYSHPNDTIVKGVILQSGSVFTNSQISAGGPSINDTAWNAVASAVGCGNTTDSTQFSCMQNVSTTDLAAAVSNTSLTFGPVLDGVTEFSDTAARAAAGDFLKVPVLAGSTANEGDVFIVDGELVEFGALIQPALDILSSITTMGFSCPTAETTEYRAAAGVSVFRYEYQAVFPNLSPFPQLRSYHTSEIPIVFGTYNISTNNAFVINTGIPAPSTPTEIALSRTVQSAWVAFAQDPKNGLRSLGWPLYDTNSSSLTIATLGNYFNATGWSLTESAVTDALCADIGMFNDIANTLEGGSSTL